MELSPLQKAAIHIYVRCNSSLAQISLYRVFCMARLDVPSAYEVMDDAIRFHKNEVVSKLIGKAYPDYCMIQTALEVGNMTALKMLRDFGITSENERYYDLCGPNILADMLHAGFVQARNLDLQNYAYLHELITLAKDTISISVLLSQQIPINVLEVALTCGCEWGSLNTSCVVESIDVETFKLMEKAVCPYLHTLVKVLVGVMGSEVLDLIRKYRRAPRENVLHYIKEDDITKIKSLMDNRWIPDEWVCADICKYATTRMLGVFKYYMSRKFQWVPVTSMYANKNLKKRFKVTSDLAISNIIRKNPDRIPELLDKIEAVKNPNKKHKIIEIVVQEAAALARKHPHRADMLIRKFPQVSPVSCLLELEYFDEAERYVLSCMGNMKDHTQDYMYTSNGFMRALQTGLLPATPAVLHYHMSPAVVITAINMQYCPDIKMNQHSGMAQSCLEQRCILYEIKYGLK
jgi:hypothetical protein